MLGPTEGQAWLLPNGLLCYLPSPTEPLPLLSISPCPRLSTGPFATPGGPAPYTHASLSIQGGPACPRHPNPPIPTRSYVPPPKHRHPVRGGPAQRPGGVGPGGHEQEAVPGQAGSGQAQEKGRECPAQATQRTVGQWEQGNGLAYARHGILTRGNHGHRPVLPAFYRHHHCPTALTPFPACPLSSSQGTEVEAGTEVVTVSVKVCDLQTSECNISTALVPA